MLKEKFEGSTIRAAGLFSTGPGGRHDWMRFHVTDVPCPHPKCFGGYLKWNNPEKTELKCQLCKARYFVKPKIRLGVKNAR